QSEFAMTASLRMPWPQPFFASIGARSAAKWRVYISLLLTSACLLALGKDCKADVSTDIHMFDGAGGANPAAPLITGAAGALYGTSFAGGDMGLGTVYRVAKDGSAFMTLHSFSGADGSSLYGGLVQGADGALYGTTYDGGSAGFGTVFTLGTDGNGFVTLCN